MGIKRCIFFLIIILSVVYILLQVPSITKFVVNTSNQATPLIEKTNTLSTIIHLSKLSVVIGKNEITINAFENSYFPDPFTLNKTNYPKVFEGDFILVEDINDTVNNKYFVIVSSNSSRSGSYQPHYFIIVNPLNNTVVYESPKKFDTAYDQTYEVIDTSVIHLNMQIYNLYSDCSNCRLSIDEYVSFDPKSGKVIPVNDRYKTFFINKLKGYEAMEKKEKCVYNGEELTILELYKKYGDSASCAGAVSYSNSPVFMTMYEYNSFKENIKLIISGEQKSQLY